MNFDFFVSKKSALIGLDVNPEAIKMVELSHIKSGLRLVNFAIEPLASGIITESVVSRPEDLAAAIGRCHAKMASKTKLVAMSLPLESVFIKHLMVSATMNDDDIEADVVQQLSALMSIDPEEISVDFQHIAPASERADATAQSSDSVVAQSASAGSDLTGVIAIAVKREKIEERLQSLEMAGLKALVLDSESLAMHTALDELLSREGVELQDKNYALVSVSDNAMALVVLRNGEAIYSRDADFDASQLLSDTVMRYGVTESMAKQIIDSQIDAPDGFDLLQKNHVQSAVQEVQRFAQLFTTSTSHVDIESIYLHGSGASMSGLHQAIAQALGVPCEVFNPFKGIEVSIEAASQGLEQHASALVVACGLAYRRVGL